MKYLFWNTNKQIINEYVKELIMEKSYDVVILAEYNDNANELLKELELVGIRMYKIKIIGCDRISFFTKAKPSKIKHCSESNYYAIKIINIDKDNRYIIGAVHLPSKLYASDEDRRVEIEDLVNNIAALEDKYNTKNTIIVGDFNANPFDGCMTKTTGLNAVSSEDVACKITRVVKNREYNMFYNPMWNKFGDFDGISGTYYYSKSSSEEIFWHIFDQVVIRPQNIKNFINSSLNIITKVNDRDLLSEGKRIKVSDHLPLEFEMK